VVAGSLEPERWLLERGAQQGEQVERLTRAMWFLQSERCERAVTRGNEPLMLAGAAARGAAFPRPTPEIPPPPPELEPETPVEIPPPLPEAQPEMMPEIPPPLPEYPPPPEPEFTQGAHHGDKAQGRRGKNGETPACNGRGGDGRDCGEQPNRFFG
jgi:hypothetical protein